MCGIFDCCCSTRKYTIYITGPAEAKKTFCASVFGIRLKDISFSETLVRFNGVPLILLVMSSEEELNDVHEMHMRMANGIIMLRNSDEAPKTNKKTLFVRMNGTSHLDEDENVIVRSVVNGSYEEAKEGVKKLTTMIKH